MDFLVAVFTPWHEFESHLRIISGWNKLESMSDNISSLISLYIYISQLDDMLESTRSIMFDDCNPPGYYTKPSSHCWVPHVWCQHPHLWSTKTQKHIAQPPFSCLNMAKPSVFFISSCSSFRILRHPAWRKATRHTLNKAQLTANKGNARTLLQGTTKERSRRQWTQCFAGKTPQKHIRFPVHHPGMG